MRSILSDSVWSDLNFTFGSLVLKADSSFFALMTAQFVQLYIRSIISAITFRTSFYGTKVWVGPTWDDHALETKSHLGPICSWVHHGPKCTSIPSVIWSQVVSRLKWSLLPRFLWNFNYHGFQSFCSKSFKRSLDIPYSSIFTTAIKKYVFINSCNSFLRGRWLMSDKHEVYLLVKTDLKIIKLFCKIKCAQKYFKKHFDAKLFLWIMYDFYTRTKTLNLALLLYKIIWFFSLYICVCIR